MWSSFYCAFCRSPRRANLRRHLGPMQVLGLAALTLFFMALFSWNYLLLFGFAALVIIGEAIARMRWRLAIVCPECGFDPVLYKNDPRSACDRVVEHIERRGENPMNVFKTPLKLPKRKLKVQAAEGQRGLKSPTQAEPVASRPKPQLVSKRI